MKNDNILIEVITQADLSGDLNIIFDTLPETEIWVNAKELLSDDDFAQNFSLTLFDAIRKNINRIESKHAIELACYGLKVLKDGLAYEAAQKVVIQNAAIYDQSSLLTAYKIFEARYKDEVNSGDQFIAAKSLEGAVLTAILGRNQGLRFLAIGLLLTEFPPVSDEQNDPGFLPILALRLLGHCYDLQTNNADIAAKNTDYLNVNNIAIRTEAQFNAGIVHLSNAFSLSNQENLVEKLKLARSFFQLAYDGEENRTDAELFLAVCDSFLCMWEKEEQSTSKKRQNIDRAKRVLVERLLMLGKDSLGYSNNFEVSIVKVLCMLEDWDEIVKQNIPERIAIKPIMSVFAGFYYSLRNLEILNSLAKNIRDISLDSIILPQIQNSFIKVQDIAERLSAILNDPYWRSLAPATEISFYEIVLSSIESLSTPKNSAAVQVRPLIEAAAKYKPEVANFIQKSYDEGRDVTEILIDVFNDSPNLESSEGPVQKILENLITNLPANFNDEYLKRCYLGVAIRHIVHYASILFNAKREEEFLFLFAEPIGLGKKAKEKNLENHFYKKMLFQPNIKVEQQPEDIAPGRPDLGIRFPCDTIFPIEVKKEDKDISKENINKNYLAQAQTYASAQSGISFLFVLDLTDKDLGTPIRNFKEYFYLDYKVVANSTFQDCVIVVIFPANRFSPSDHSWKR